MVNIEVLDKALDWIEKNPDQHRQSVWFQRTDCGTGMCLAGVVATQHGWTPDWSAGRLSGYGEETSLVMKGDDYGKVSSVARGLLGLELEDSELLFDAENSLDDLKAMRDDLAAGHSLS